MKFFDSIHCTGGLHCSKCRSTLAGAELRKSLMENFDDIDTQDFDCPKGKPWVKTKVKRIGNKVYLDGKECIPCQQKSEA